MEHPSRMQRIASNKAYPWLVLGLLWFCGFFNYADRQAVSSVVPLIQKEFVLSDVKLGLLGSAFMVVYASTSPFAGYLVDRVTRKILIPVGLAFWSLICAATGMSQSFEQLIFFRAAEGLGESFYFPASLSFLADYHGKGTRSRALGIHQTSVYLGTAGGFAGRPPGPGIGVAISVLRARDCRVPVCARAGFFLVEPLRGQSEESEPANPEPTKDNERDLARQVRQTCGRRSPGS